MPLRICLTAQGQARPSSNEGSCGCRHSYVEGRLRLAEKERARKQAKVAGPGINLLTAPSGPSSQVTMGPALQCLG